MKKTYTKKQITEAIAYWKNQLKKMNENQKPIFSSVDELIKSFLEKLYEVHSGVVAGCTKEEFTKEEFINGLIVRFDQKPLKEIFNDIFKYYKTHLNTLPDKKILSHDFFGNDNKYDLYSILQSLCSYSDDVYKAFEMLSDPENKNTVNAPFNIEEGDLIENTVAITLKSGSVINNGTVMLVRWISSNNVHLRYVDTRSECIKSLVFNLDYVTSQGKFKKSSYKSFEDYTKSIELMDFNESDIYKLKAPISISYTDNYGKKTTNLIYGIAIPHYNDEESDILYLRPDFADDEVDSRYTVRGHQSYDYHRPNIDDVYIVTWTYNV